MTQEAAAEPGSITLHGQTVTFVLPAWALEQMLPPLDVPARPRKAAAYGKTWAKMWSSPVSWEMDGLDKSKLAAVVARREPPERIDPDLEAYLVAATYLRSESKKQSFETMAMGLADWTQRSDAATATKIGIRGIRVAGMMSAMGHGIMLALREHVRAHGAQALRPTIELELERTDDGLRALLLDDSEAAARVVEATPSPEWPIIGVLAAPNQVCTALEAGRQWAVGRHDPGDLIRAIRRHGLAVADVMLAHAQAVFEQPGHRDSERAPWLPLLAFYPSERAARLAFSMMGSKSAQKTVLQVFGEMKPQALSVLTELSQAKGKQGKLAQTALEALG
ncbi:MAG: hypothetical protein K8H88_29800 [Sandaracinaceae bacterium]|nr:hypothetical protein [Sandaracinaceae bacterium]